jgi:protein CpxP
MEEDTMLKNCLLAFVVAGLTYMATTSAVAQDNGSSGQQSAAGGAQPEYGRGGRGYHDPAKRAKMLTKQLNLSSDQQAKVLDILKLEQLQVENLRSNSALSQDDRRSKMMDIHKSSKDQIRALLTPDQQKRLDEMQSKHEQWMGHHPGGQTPGAAPDGSEQK